MLFHFPSPMVYYERIPEHDQIKDELLEYIDDDVEGNAWSYSNKSNWQCDVTSSFFRSTPLEFINSDHLDAIVWNPLRRFSMEVPEHQMLGRFTTVLKEFWYNQYSEGQHQEVHTHNTGSSAPLISGIYILELDEPNTTQFIHEVPVWCQTSHHIYTTPDIEEGSVILFPADLQHYVNPVKSKRTTISFNIGAQQ